MSSGRPSKKLRRRQENSTKIVPGRQKNKSCAFLAGKPQRGNPRDNRDGAKPGAVPWWRARLA